MAGDTTKGGHPRAADAMPRGGDDLPARDARSGAPARPLTDRQSRPAPGEDPAAGTIDHPIAPGEAQAGDLAEQAANLGGPVDVFPLRQRQRRERPPG